MNKILDIRSRSTRVMSCVNIICVLLVLTLLSFTIGVASASVFHIIALFLLLGILLLNLPIQHTIRNLTKTNPHIYQLLGGIILIVIGFLVLVLTNTQLLWISSIPVFLSGLYLSLQAIDQNRNELQLLVMTSFWYTLVVLFLQTLPFLWYGYKHISLVVSHGVGVITGTPLSLGPTTSGLGIILPFLILLFVMFYHNAQKSRKEILAVSLSIGGLFLIWILYLFFLDFFSFSSKNDALNYHLVFFLFCLIPIFTFLLRQKQQGAFRHFFLRKGYMRQLLKDGTVWAALLLFLSTIVLTSFVTNRVSPGEPPKILFYGDHMLGTWDVPEYGKYGKDAVGMFGLWPIYLTSLGYTTEIVVQNRTNFLQVVQPPDQNITRYLNLTDYTTIIESEEITQATLDGISIFVVSNLNISFTAEEQTVIWNFVKDGGSLLVIGDHTNVGGIQEPLNNLLAPIGIRYRFDAALPLDEKFKWLTCSFLPYHPITATLLSPEELQYGVGASLDISSSSIPIVIGTVALSDTGNQTNQDIAYLGDYEYNKGEQLGDVILVAGGYYGEGKVLVFGDTSSFQNPAIPFSFSFVQNSFSWLASTQTAMVQGVQIGASLILLLGALVVYRLLKNKALPFALFPLVLCLALLFSVSINPLLIHNSFETKRQNLVLLDASHAERFTLDSFTDDSINGLLLNLQRNNYLPVVIRQYSEEKISVSTLLIFIAPTSAFSPEEVTFLRQYMSNGGFIILATGYEDEEASLPLLRGFDVNIQSTPLGPVPYIEGNLSLYQNEPRFVDSWPISFQPNQTISYYNFTWENHTFHLVVFIHYGAGGLLLLSDSQYLLDKNIESIYDYWPGNILFLKHLLNELHAMEEAR
jgi:hypothetical protein